MLKLQLVKRENSQARHRSEMEANATIVCINIYIYIYIHIYISPRICTLACAQIVLVSAPPRIGENSSEAPITIESECDYSEVVYVYAHSHTIGAPPRIGDPPHTGFSAGSGTCHRNHTYTDIQGGWLSSKVLSCKQATSPLNVHMFMTTFL